jgi:hypothetical protein
VIIFLLALLIISWPPTVQDRCGGIEVMGYYELTSHVGTMEIDPLCPDEEGIPQLCAHWKRTRAVFIEPRFELQEPLVGQVLYWEEPVAVDIAGNRSDAPHIPGECGP